MSLYFLLQGEEVTGPYALSDLSEHLQQGNLAVDSMVCPEGSDQWETLSGALERELSVAGGGLENAGVLSTPSVPQPTIPIPQVSAPKAVVPVVSAAAVGRSGLAGEPVAKVAATPGRILDVEPEVNHLARNIRALVALLILGAVPAFFHFVMHPGGLAVVKKSSITYHRSFSTLAGVTAEMDAREANPNPTVDPVFDHLVSELTNRGVLRVKFKSNKPAEENASDSE